MPGRLGIGVYPPGLLTGTFAAGFLVAAQGVLAQDEPQAAGALFDEAYQAEVGRTVPEPAPGHDLGAVAEVASCQATCDAFVPRQPILSFEWDNIAVGTGITPSTDGADASIRIDISGTATGFEEGEYGTIRLSQIPVAPTVVLDPVTAIPAPGGEVLLNRVEADSIVERPSDVPIFPTADAMNQSMRTVDPGTRAALEADQRTGSLGQIRVLARGSAEMRGSSHQVVSMTGVQPGATYRLRLVAEGQGGAEQIVEQICRIPVCPADFLGPGE